jgi:hypothetical protein
MGRGVTMPCVGVEISWVGVRYTMGKKSKYHGWGSKYIKNIEPLIHGIFNLYPWYIDPLPMVF